MVKVVNCHDEHKPQLGEEVAFVASADEQLAPPPVEVPVLEKSHLGVWITLAVIAVLIILLIILLR